MFKIVFWKKNFFEIWRFEKHIALSEKKSPLLFILDKALNFKKELIFLLFEVLKEFGKDLKEPRSDKMYS